MIEVRDLTKFYGDVRALRNVNFSVKPGEIIGLLGPNGAGKTTLMKIMTGFLLPDSGTVSVGGFDVIKHIGKVQEMIGYLPENAPLYPELTVQSHLRLMADLRRIPAPEQQKLISAAVLAAGLKSRLTRPISTLSKGFRQRVGLAQAILHKPHVLVLDEPTNGLDPTQILEVRNLIKKLALHSTVIISTHILSEVEATCDRAIIIMNGEVRADSKLSELSSDCHAVVTLDPPENINDAINHLRAIPHVTHVEKTDKPDGKLTFRVQVADGRDVCPQIFQAARKNDWQLTELRNDRQTLESVFSELAGAAGGSI